MAQNCKPVNNFLDSLPVRRVIQKPVEFLSRCGIIVASIRKAKPGMDVDPARLDFPEVKLKIPIDPATSIERQLEFRRGK
jgi:hypothetical protein